MTTIACGPGLPGGSPTEATESDGATPESDVRLAGYCVLLEQRVKCWGRNENGRLGLGDTLHRGDAPGEMGSALPDVDLGSDAAVSNVVVGPSHACALLENGQVKCWGRNTYGELGLGDTNDRGDEPGEMGDALPPVDLGRGVFVSQLALGSRHTCALLDDGAVKCWGRNDHGSLGLGDKESRGDDPGEMGDMLPPISLGQGVRPTALVAGTEFTCALLEDRHVKCWGANGGGELGLGDTEVRGDDLAEMGDALPTVELGADAEVKSLHAGQTHTCALLMSGRVKCWGGNGEGQLGLGDRRGRGGSSNDMGDRLPAVDLGGPGAVDLAVGLRHSCVILEGGDLKCWGNNGLGQLGLGDRRSRGAEPGQMGDALPSIDLGSDVVRVYPHVGDHATCALLVTGDIRCWGQNDRGQLGVGDTEDRGDDPGEVGPTLPRLDVGD